MRSDDAYMILKEVASDLGLNSIVGVFPSEAYAIGFADGEMRRGSEELSAQVVIHITALDGYAVACTDDTVDSDTVEVCMGRGYNKVARDYTDELPVVLEI